MPFKTDTIEEPTLNLTPMIDIVLLLVIFFMVGTQFSEEERQYSIELPTVSDAQPLTALPDELVVNVDGEGRIYIEDRELTTDELEQELTAARERYADQAVVIRGDADGPYQNVMTILSICKDVKIRNVQLANRLESEGGS
ncbi:biopolymer transporter ExbD [Maioricimonas sp. JC845]|uniref:ExbD/TolR family protein n=1 Tax=Maioricimonas sp. JC845 TaxID=3232138 RepID=UPI003457C088